MTLIEAKVNLNLEQYKICFYLNKYVSKGLFKKTKSSILIFSKVVLEILSKFCFLPNLKAEVQRIWISCQKRLKLQMGVAGPFFEPRPSNLVRIHFILSCKSAEIFVVIFQLVFNLAKISVSVLSIS